MDRHWLLTSTFYGNWLPGEQCGFVSRVRDRRPDDPESASRLDHNEPKTEYDRDIAGLRQSARELMRGEPIRLNAEQARILMEQFKETARFRNWKIYAAAIMADHVHLVVGVNGDPEPWKILGDFKSYGSRALTRQFGKPASETWWTSKGSTRKLPDEKALQAAIAYVLNQKDALAIYAHEDS